MMVGGGGRGWSGTEDLEKRFKYRMSSSSSKARSCIENASYQLGTKRATGCVKYAIHAYAESAKYFPLVRHENE